MQRSDLLQLIEAALAAKLPEYVRQLAERHLADWPGDLGVQLALARAHAAEGRPAKAADLLEALIAVDPEDSVAQRLLAGIYLALDKRPAALRAFANAHVGDGHGLPGAAPPWSSFAREAFLAERVGDWAAAQREALAAAQAEPDSSLAALLHMAAHWHAGQLHLARPMAEAGLARWPWAVAFMLCLAECLLAAGDHPRAIKLLHEAAARDAAGQVVGRHWGANHPYRSLWDMRVSVTLPGPLPGELVALLGLNRLNGQGEGASHGPAGGLPGVAEEIAEIQALLDALAARLPSRDTVKHRLHQMKSAATGAPPEGQPSYVVVSSRTRLIQLYGMGGFSLVDTALRDLVTRGSRRAALKPCLLYVDDPGSLSPYGLRPANPANAWEVKSLIGKLASRLKSLNSLIGAILIVGGADVIPFHHLPNPTDDVDPDIPSDNPYATADENYFVPEWPIGRIPTGAGNDPAPLLHAIRLAAGSAPVRGLQSYIVWPATLPAWLREWWLRRFGPPSFGYSANVWRTASAAVYTSIGDPRELLTSPPLDANALPIEGLAPSRLSYFNLHGIEDGPEWYGQRSVNDSGTLPEYPIALRPADVSNSGRAPIFVFSEACYGANIVGKQVEDALCLKFLASGTRVVVASTKIAYGSVNTPLIGADLLGRCFWQNVNQGLPAGESLRRAKLQMAQEMHQRQGFLDGEDQKTLISFVLYGDPLAIAPISGAAKGKFGKPLPVPKAGRPVTVCDKATGKSAPSRHPAELSAEQVEHIKTAVARYLPGMLDADISVAGTHAECSGVGHVCPTAQLSPRRKSRAMPSASTVVTLSKTIRSNARMHPHYARLTLNASGEVVKLAVSR